jgi:hypothetical protein
VFRVEQPIMQKNRLAASCPQGETMDVADTGSNASPASSGGYRMMALNEARDIARRDPTGWYADASGGKYCVGKGWAQAAAVVRCHIVDENNEPFCFATFADAATFLHARLGILRVVKLV